MNNFEYFVIFLIGVFIFSLFFVLISLLGYSILWFVQRKNNYLKAHQKNPFLVNILLSFGLGTSVYISYGYFLVLFNWFNFISGYFFIILFDLGFISVLIYNKRRDLSFLVIKQYILSKLQKQILIRILSFIGIYIFSFLLYWNILTDSVGLIKLDPYKWLGEIYFILDNHTLSLDYIGYNYPSGFALFISGFLLPWNNYEISYFFLKFTPILNIFLILLVMYYIGRRLFKNQILVYLSLILVLGSVYFVSRNIINVASSFGAILVAISFLVIVYNFSDFLMGFFISALFLIHPLTLFFYSIAFITFFSLKLFVKSEKKKIVANFMIPGISFVLILFILILPYFLLYFGEIGDIFNWYRDIIFNPNFEIILIENLISQAKLILLFPLDFFSEFIDRKLLVRIHNISTHTINSFYLISLLGIIIIILRKKKDIKNYQSSLFFLICYLFVLIFNLLPYFFIGLNLIDTFSYRTFEVFMIPIIVVLIYFIDWIVDKSKNLSKILQVKARRFVKKNKSIKKIIRLDIIIILFTILNLVPLFDSRWPPEYYYYYDDEYVEIILYIRNNGEEKSSIFYPYFERDYITFILYDMNTYSYNITSNQRFSEFDKELRINHINFLIIENSNFPEDWVKQLKTISNFDLIMVHTNYSLYYKGINGF